MSRLGIEFLSVFGMPPVQFVNLAADLGCAHISIGLTPIPFNPHNYPLWSLREDAALRRDMVSAMTDRNVSISLGEGFIVRAGVDISERAADLDLMCGLGVKRINTAIMDPDLNRCYEQIAKLVEMADEVGVETTLEFGPGLTIVDLPGALETIRNVGNPNLRLLIDTMHFFRSGSDVKQLAALDPDLIGYVQLSDVPVTSTYSNYMEEAMDDRKVPGMGELPLADILSVVARNLVVGLEVPQKARAESGLTPVEYLEPCVSAARNLLATLP